MDIRAFFKALRTMNRDVSDNGRVGAGEAVLLVDGTQPGSEPDPRVVRETPPISPTGGG